MKKDLLPSEGQFYKTNLHAHTTLSDGHLMPQQLKDAYKEPPAMPWSLIPITGVTCIIPNWTMRTFWRLPPMR